LAFPSEGVMTVIADWPHVPKHADVKRKIDEARNGYVGFALCTPTSILPAGGNGNVAVERFGFRRGM
jgi:hypothetical protein